MRFIIIDDVQWDIDRLRAILRQIYPGAEILPDEVRDFTNWDAVRLYLEQSMDGNGQNVVFFDMSLNKNMNTVYEAVEHCHTLKATFQKKNPTFIAYTLYDRVVRANNFKDAFDGLIDKQTMQTARDPAERTEY